MKKILLLALAAALLLSLCACAAGTPAATKAPAADKPFTVGICQIVQHPALDSATQGFMDVLKAEFGDKVTFQNQNAAGDIPTCTTIINGFVSNNVDLILANATPPLQAAAAATTTIPIIGTSITDYASALDIANWTGTVGGNISGASDLAPLDQQAAMVRDLFPEAKTVGLLYCSAEANSEYQVKEMEKLLKDLGFTTARYAFTDSNDVSSVTQAAADACDVIFIPTDNTAANNTEAIANVVIPAGVPCICGEEGLCRGCGVATLSIDYYELGRISGEMAVKVLKGEDISKMPIQFAPTVTKKVNVANCEALGIPVPEGYEPIGD